MRTLIGVNTLTQVDQMAYSNHMQIMYRMGKNHPTDDFILFHPKRMSIDAMRNNACKIALEHELDYILFLDDDVIVPIFPGENDFFKKLVTADKDIIAGHTIIRGYPFNNMFFKHPDGDKTKLDFYNDPELDEDGLIKCDAIGCSLVLIKTSLLKKIPPPYFVTGVRHTEDIYFCMQARKYVPDCSIYVDPSIKTCHIMSSQVVSPDNIAAWKAFEEFEDKSLLEEKIDNNRREAYLHQCLTFE